jgi:death on curing protein
MSEPDSIQFVTLEEVLELHEMQMARYGGAGGIRDQGLLESAMAQPQASFDSKPLHKDIFLMAAAYAFHIAQNQPFLDGNKRTGLLAALVFLDLNGIAIDTPSQRLEEAMLAIAERKMDKSNLASLFRELAHQNP